MSQFELRTLLLLVPFFVSSDIARAQGRERPDEGPIYTDAARVDEDYAFQGEYRGWVQTQPNRRSSQMLALQVIALGDGRFEGVKLFGGLPGEGWAGHRRVVMRGLLLGQVVHLEDDLHRVTITEGTATVRSWEGASVGELRHVTRVSPTMGLEPPDGAIVLFDGRGTQHFVDAKRTEEGLLMAGTETAAAFGDFRLHAEFRVPYKPFARGQARGNSGFYLQSRYEVQVLDSFGLEGLDDECGALYRTRRPDVNMCYPPLTWQTYDIDFTAPRFDDDGHKVSNMRISVWHNGVRVHNDAQIPNKTGAGRPEGPLPLPTKLQDHSNPVVFRNLWLIDKSSTEAMEAANEPRIASRRVAPVPIAVIPPPPTLRAAPVPPFGTSASADIAR